MNEEPIEIQQEVKELHFSYSHTQNKVVFTNTDYVSILKEYACKDVSGLIYDFIVCKIIYEGADRTFGDILYNCKVQKLYTSIASLSHNVKGGHYGCIPACNKPSKAISFSNWISSTRVYNTQQNCYVCTQEIFVNFPVENKPYKFKCRFYETESIKNMLTYLDDKSTGWFKLNDVQFTRDYFIHTLFFKNCEIRYKNHKIYFSSDEFPQR